MLLTSIFFFSHNIFYPMNDNFNVLTKIYFVVCKCFFNLDKPKMLSSGKRLNFLLIKIIFWSQQPWLSNKSAFFPKIKKKKTHTTLFQTVSVFSNPKALKTLQEREKMLVSATFSPFSTRFSISSENLS